MPAYTSLGVREAIVRHHEDGLTQRAIARELGVGLSTVNHWITRHIADRGLETRPKSGRARKTTRDVDDSLFRLSSSQPFLPATELRHRLELDHVSAQTVRNRLRERGLKCHVPATKEILSDAHRRARHAFALRYLDWTAEQWQRVIFSDEKSFCSHGFGPLRVWRPARGHRYDDRYIKKQAVSGRFNIPVWACISGRASVDHIHRITDRNLTARYYVTYILENLFSDDDASEMYFVHDRSSIHTAGIVRTWLAENNVREIEWPAKAPDLNPIENVWAEMERRTADRRPSNEAELWDVVHETFYELERDYIHNLLSSMPDRLQRVVEAEGAWTRY